MSLIMDTSSGSFGVLRPSPLSARDSSAYAWERIMDSMRDYEGYDTFGMGEPTPASIEPVPFRSASTSAFDDGRRPPAPLCVFDEPFVLQQILVW
jgi:hypothetical protein